MKFKKHFLLAVSLILLLSVSAAYAQDIDEDISFDDTLSDSIDETPITENENTEEITANSNTIYISPTGTGSGLNENDPSNWNSAIYSANSGDTIQFLDGNYTNVRGTVYVDVELKGNGASTRIDAEGNGGFFTVSPTATVTLNNLHFVNADTGKYTSMSDKQKTGNDGDGGLVNYGVIYIKNCYFGNNTGWGTKGGTIHNTGTCYIYDSVFFGHGGKKGGAIYTEDNSKLYIYNTLFNKGISKEGNAVNAKKSYVEIHNSSVVNSSAKNGMFSIKESTLIIYDSYFFNSRAVDTGAVLSVDKKSTVEIVRCNFDKLTSTGGAVWFTNGEKYGAGDGGAIILEKDARISIRDSNFTNCNAKNDGGAIYVNSGSSATINNCTFKSNSAGGQGRHIYSLGTISLTNSVLESVATLTTQNINEGEKENIAVKIDEGTNFLNVNVNVLVDGKTVGTASKSSQVVVSDLKPSQYVAELSQKDNSNTNSYIFINGSSVFVVVGENSKINTSLDLGNYNVYYGGCKIVTTLRDNKGNPISGKNIIITVNGKSQSAKTDNNGVASVETNLNPGTYNIVVKFNQDLMYNSCEAKSILKVSSSVKASDMTRGYNSGLDFQATFLDKTGKALSNTAIKFTVDGKTYTVKTLSNGVAKLNVKLSVGTHSVSAVNPVTGEKFTKKVTITKRITNNKDLTLDYLSGACFTVRVIGDNGKYAGAGQVVVMKVCGKTYNVKTDKNGYAKLPINLLPKSYKITVSYKGSTVSNKIVVKQVLKTKNYVVSKKTKSIKVYAVLKNSKGIAIKNKKLTFKFLGKTYSAKTNAKGIATIYIKNVYKVGKYTIATTYVKTTLKNTIRIK